MDMSTKNWKDTNMPTKKQFEAYKEVQYRGNWNMIMDSRMAAMEAGLSDEVYWNIIHNYAQLKEIYG